MLPHKRTRIAAPGVREEIPDALMEYDRLVREAERRGYEPGVLWAAARIGQSALGAEHGYRGGRALRVPSVAAA